MLRTGLLSAVAALALAFAAPAVAQIRATLQDDARRCAAELAKPAPELNDTAFNNLLAQDIIKRPEMKTRLTSPEAQELDRLDGQRDIKVGPVELLRITRRSLELSRRVHGENGVMTLLHEYTAAMMEQANGHYAEADMGYRRFYQGMRLLGGDRNSVTLYARHQYFEFLAERGRCGEALALLSAPVISPLNAGMDLDRWGKDLDAAMAKLDAADFAGAEAAFRRLLAVTESQGEMGIFSGLPQFALGIALDGQGREAEAVGHLRNAARLLSDGDFSPTGGNEGLALPLALMALKEERYGEAEFFLRPIATRARDDMSAPNRFTIGYLALAVVGQDRYAEAEEWARLALEPANKDEAGGTGLSVLSMVLTATGRTGESVRLLEQDRAVKMGPPSKSVGKAVLLSQRGTADAALAQMLNENGEYERSLPLSIEAAAFHKKAFGPSHPQLIQDEFFRLQALSGLRRWTEAAPGWRAACQRLEATSAGFPMTSRESAIIHCEYGLGLSLFDLAGVLGEDADGLRRETFEIAQRANRSAAGRAVSAVGARSALANDPAAQAADDYEAALARREALDRVVAQTYGSSSASAQRVLQERRAREDARVRELHQSLEALAPRYLDYREPAVVPLAALQSGSGQGNPLLGADEVLISFLVPEGSRRGVVFAVTRERAAWARMGLSSLELGKAVRKLRPGRARLGFDRQAAYDLHQALFGDPAIAEVLLRKSNLLVVPVGPLTSLPFGLLLTRPPGGDKGPPALVLRNSPWLLRDKAITVLPQVASLRTLRTAASGPSGKARDPLLVFADPDFGPSAPVVKGGAEVQVRGGSLRFDQIGSYGGLRPNALRALPRLPGAATEAEALRKALAAGPWAVLTGAGASKAELLSRNADARLANVEVLAFATHGLVSGNGSAAAEPVLIMAADKRKPVPGDEVLLSASEIAGLKLSADWVILSACDSAAGDQPEAFGISGLTRAFFYAGARSVVVSQWKIRDDVAARLVPAMLVQARLHPEISKAEALRRATLAVLDDPALDATDPTAWAGLVLVGGVR